MINDECQISTRTLTVRWVPCIRHFLFAILLLVPVLSRAEPDKDMSGLIGKLEGIIGTNSIRGASTNEASLLSPPLPEIPPTPWERYSWVVWLVLPFIVMMVGIVAAFLLRPGKPPVLSSPAAQARVALTALQARPEDGAILSQISRTLRRYLVVAFWLNPSETTTSEFCVALAKNPQVGPELSGVISEFLRSCDERKFSPAAGTPIFAAASRASELVDMAEMQRTKRQRAGALHDAAAVAGRTNA